MYIIRRTLGNTRRYSCGASQIGYTGRWNTDSQGGKWSGWGGPQIYFKVAGTTYVDFVTACIDPDASALCFLTYTIDNNTATKTVVYLSTAGATTNGLVTGRIIIPDTGEHTVIANLAGLNANMYAQTSKTTLNHLLIPNNASISSWTTGSKIVQCVGDSWMAQEADWPRLMDTTRYTLYPIASGGLKCSDMDTQYNNQYSGQPASDINADAVLVSFGVNDFNAGVSTAAFETSMYSVFDKIRVLQPTAKIFLIRVPSNIGASKDYGQYGANMATVVAARSNAYYIDTSSLDATITWADGDPNHLGPTGKQALADYVKTQIQAQGI